MATLAAILIILLGAIPTLTTNDITPPPPSNIVHSTLDKLQESTSNAKHVTTAKVPIQDVSNNLQSMYTTTISSLHQENSQGTTSNHNTTTTITQLKKKEASTAYKSDDEVVTTTDLPIQSDNGDVSTTRNTTGAMHTVSNTILATYDTTFITRLQNDSMMSNQTAAIVPSSSVMSGDVTKTILPTQNLTSNYVINTTTSTANDSSVTVIIPAPNQDEHGNISTRIIPKSKENIQSNENETPQRDSKTKEVPKTTKPAAWILPTLLIIVALSLVALLIHAKWEDHLNNLCFRDCLWVQMCSSGSERQQLNGKLGEGMDVGNIDAEGSGGNGNESGFGGGEEGEICNGADKLEGDFTVTFEETKL
ncbi:hypothetical protein NQD34_000595 [Periophthalmus magnuspinnatus]|nr:hypothetical protein NQD34_000595 [Periophthalmus magnuspinnatus]